MTRDDAEEHARDARIALELGMEIIEGADLLEAGRRLADHEVDRVLWLLSMAHKSARQLENLGEVVR